MENKVAFITLGCKVNQYETNAMTQQLLQKSYEIVENNQKADIYIINTCTVTNMSDRKSRQMLRKVKELNINSIVIACGCYAQVAKEELEKIQEIDIVLGNNEKNNIVDAIEKYIDKKNKYVKVEDIMNQKEFIEFGNVNYTEKTRAVIKVQDGCDRFCSYCIIPFARGRVRSRNPKEVVSEIEKITTKGIKEVVITGIHIASYGKDFNNGYKLIDLLEEINKIKGIDRIRLGSIEPLLITDGFIKRLKNLDKICHHFHLSLQSGCNKTLDRMNRKYTIEQFKAIVKTLRKEYKDVVITTDIIVGFPGETKEEFEETYNILKHIKLYKLHVFKYSPRKGTKAAVMQNQIDTKEKERRSNLLIELSNTNQIEINKKYIEKEVEVLFEEKENEYYKGHTSNYILVYFKSEENIENKILKVKCKKTEDDYIIA